jgi:hypothetical protein
MPGKTRHPATSVAWGLVFLLAVGALGFFLRAPSGPVAAVALGISCSLIASFVFAFVNALFLGGDGLRLSDDVKSLGGSLGALKLAVPLLAQAEAQRVRAVKPKADYHPEEWRALLSEAEWTLVMVGHALDKWCRTDGLRKHFCEAIERVLGSGGEVHLLMLSRHSVRVEVARKKNYGERVSETLAVLSELHAGLGVTERRGLHVYELAEELEMPYMAVANGRILIVAPYPATVQTSDGMPAITLAHDSEIAEAFRADIERLIAKHGNAVDLTSC